MAGFFRLDTFEERLEEVADRLQELDDELETRHSDGERVYERLINADLALQDLGDRIRLRQEILGSIQFSTTPPDSDEETDSGFDASSGLISGLTSDLPSGLISGLTSDLLTDLPSEFISGLDSFLASDLPYSPPSGPISGLPSGLISGLPSGLITGFPSNLSLPPGLPSALPSGRLPRQPHFSCSGFLEPLTAETEDFLIEETVEELTISFEVPANTTSISVIARSSFNHTDISIGSFTQMSGHEDGDSPGDWMLGALEDAHVDPSDCDVRAFLRNYYSPRTESHPEGHDLSTGQTEGQAGSSTSARQQLQREQNAFYSTGAGLPRVEDFPDWMFEPTQYETGATQSQSASSSSENESSSPSMSENLEDFDDDENDDDDDDLEDDVDGIDDDVEYATDPSMPFLRASLTDESVGDEDLDVEELEEDLEELEASMHQFEEHLEGAVHRLGDSSQESSPDDDRASPDRFYQQMHLRIFQTLLHHASSLDASADRERMMRFLMESPEDEWEDEWEEDPDMSRVPGLTDHVISSFPVIVFAKVKGQQTKDEQEKPPQSGSSSPPSSAPPPPSPPGVRTRLQARKRILEQLEAERQKQLRATSNDSPGDVRIPSKSLAVPFVTQKTCTICLADFEEGAALTQLPDCGHVFDGDCIRKWLTETATCPICRNVVGGGDDSLPAMDDEDDEFYEMEESWA